MLQRGEGDQLRLGVPEAEAGVFHQQDAPTDLIQAPGGLHIPPFRLGDFVQQSEQPRQILVFVGIVVALRTYAQGLGHDPPGFRVKGCGNLLRGRARLGRQQVHIASREQADGAGEPLDQVKMPLRTSAVARHTSFVILQRAVGTAVKQVGGLLVAPSADRAHGSETRRRRRVVAVASGTGRGPRIVLLQQQVSVYALAVLGHDLRGEIILAHQRAILVAGATGIRHV